MALHMQELVKSCHIYSADRIANIASFSRAFSLVLLGLILMVTQTKEADRSIKEWNKLTETIIEAANTEALTLALRAYGQVPLNIFYFYITSKFTTLFFNKHSTSTTHIY